jgi:hypothetical protein
MRVLNWLAVDNETCHWIPVSVLHLQDTYSRKSWTVSEFNYIQRHPYDFNKSCDTPVSDSSEKLSENFNNQRTVRHFASCARSIHRCPTLKWSSPCFRFRRSDSINWLWIFRQLFSTYSGSSSPTLEYCAELGHSHFIPHAFLLVCNFHTVIPCHLMWPFKIVIK